MLNLLTHAKLQALLLNLSKEKEISNYTLSILHQLILSQSFQT